MAEQIRSNTVELSPTKFCDVDYCELIDDALQSNGNSSSAFQLNVVQSNMHLLISLDNEHLFLYDPTGKENRWFSFANNQISFIGQKVLLIIPKNAENRISSCLKFHTDKEASDFEKALKLCQLLKPSSSKPKPVENTDSLFDSRTEQNSADLYFQFYGYLNQQQNMLQDFVRTSTYQNAILSNRDDFNGKVVMDVGAGTGVLSFFAIQSGAARVYAIEASSMAIYCQELVRTNNLNERIMVIPGKVEDVNVPEQVDIIISEPMGYSLVNERMLESFVYARKYLKPGGRMFPSVTTMYFALFSDELIYQENIQKTLFWFNQSFHGIDIRALRAHAFAEVFKQPVIDTWSSAILCSELCTWNFDFEKDPVEKLHLIEIPFTLKITRPCLMHGIASWFDVSFNGSQVSIVLSTGPDNPLTHWYQVRYFFPDPFLVHAGDIVNGKVVFKANEKLSYDVDISATVNGIEKRNRLDLKNPNFRYMAGGANVQVASVNYYDGSMATNVQNVEPPPPETNNLNMSVENVNDDANATKQL